MIVCTECATQGRVGYVDEKAPQGVRVTYICPNSRCGQYEQEIGEEILQKKDADEQ